MNYKDAVEYINSFINFEKIPKYQYASAFKLERMHAILEELGNPHKDLNTIHVAGSKGKGSTCAITAYILKEAGYKVGLYTSPHLLDFRERIRVLAIGNRQPDVFEGMISEKEISDIVEEIKSVAENFREHKIFGAASFFEILTACAFLYFKKKQVDIAVLETGLGGRLDATNITMPLICGITNISLEHTDKLGDTLDKIAHEKAGIIKSQKLKVASARQEKEAMDVIKKVCVEKKAELYEIGKDMKFTVVKSNEKSQAFDLKGPGYSYKNLELNLIGCHQIENASLGVGMLKLIDPDRFKIQENDIREGLKKAVWPGRLQIIRKKPYVVLDGAHNLASAAALADSIKRLFDYKKLICVFGISSDKDIKGVSSVISAISDIIILTKASSSPRAEDISGLKQNFKDSPRRRASSELVPRCEAKPGIEESGNVEEAIEKAFGLADKDDLILITGSLFVVGDAVQYCSKLTN